MARQSINVNPGLKEFEAYMDFSGGLNTETSNERLLDNEFVVMENVVLNSRGSVKKRPGRQVDAVFSLPSATNVQGMFFFHRPVVNVTQPDLIFALGGKLYVRPYNSVFVTQIPLNGNNSNTFQSTRNVESVQFYDSLYVASGGGLIRVDYNPTFDTFTATSVTPYQPSAQEIKFIGLNALYPSGMTTTDDPSLTSLNDFYVKGILFRDKDGNIVTDGVVNQDLDLTAYLYYDSTLITPPVTYTWHFRKSGTTSWSNFGTTTNTSEFSFHEAGSFDFKVTARFHPLVGGGHVDKEFVFTGFESLPYANSKKPYQGEGGVVTNCNRILLHYNRLFLYGDPSEPAQVYISHLANPGYFPSTNTLRFDTGRFEPITTIVRIQNYLTVFSRSMIHIISGINPEEYSVNMINDSVGCIAERSAVLTGNVITFLSQEGVYILRPTTFKLDQLNVQRVDAKIKDEMPKDVNCCALNYDSQYWLCFPDKSIMYRYYYEQQVWVKDVSTNLQFVQLLQYQNMVYNLSKDLRLYKHNDAVFLDGSIEYDMVVETKYFDLSKSFNFKKLRRLYILGRCYKDYDAEFNVYVYADSALVLDPETGQAIITPGDVAQWQITITPNAVFEHGSTFGIWELGEDEFGQDYLNVQKTRVRGKCRRVKLRFTNTQSNEVEIFGFGLEFKVKKP
jgi:hypothetical protein